MNRFAALFDDIALLWGKYGSSYLNGVGSTLLLAVIATLVGCVIGFLCGILQTIPCSHSDPLVKRGLLGLLRGIIRAYIEIFRGTPMILQAVFIYYGLPYFTNNAVQFRNIWAVSILVVSINTGAYMAESVRGGILSVDRGQTEGAYSVGMTHAQAMVHVILPQALRNILPSVSNEFVINIKDTSVLNVIGVMELYYMAGVIYRRNYQIFQTYLIICVLYFLLTFTVTRLLRLLERKLDGAKNYTICGSQSDPAAEIHIHEQEDESWKR